MERIYYHYLEWEDFHNGLYDLDKIDNPNKLIKSCANLLKDVDSFYKIMLNVIQEWRKSSEVNLTNTSRNRQAWLGQASCCYKYNAPEYITKLAWRTLTKDQQDKANDMADKVIFEWEKIYINGKQMRLSSYA